MPYIRDQDKKDLVAVRMDRSPAEAVAGILLRRFDRPHDFPPTAQLSFSFFRSAAQD